MDVIGTEENLTKRITTLYLTATTAGEELLLTEMMRVVEQGKARDKIKVMRADGESYLTWMPRNAREP